MSTEWNTKTADRGIRSKGILIKTDDQEVYMDGAYSAEIISVGDGEAGIILNGDPPYEMRNFDAQQFTFKLPNLGYPRYDIIKMTSPGPRQGEIYIRRDFIIPVTKEDQQTIYEAEQG